MPIPTTYDERLERLLRTAARIFAEQGFDRTSMRDLARETGLSLAGIYHYVDGKDELLFLIQHRCFESVMAGAEAELARGGMPLERLERFIRHHVTFFAANMSEMKVLSHEAASVGRERIAGINRLKRRYVDMLSDIMREVVGPGSDLDPAVAAYALFGMMNWIYTWYRPSGQIQPEALAQQFISIILNGVAGSRELARDATRI